MTMEIPNVILQNKSTWPRKFSTPFYRNIQNDHGNFQRHFIEALKMNMEIPNLMLRKLKTTMEISNVVLEKIFTIHKFHRGKWPNK